jgi:hypothetical protein
MPVQIAPVHWGAVGDAKGVALALVLYMEVGRRMLIGENFNLEATVEAY